jgi:phage-related protein
MSDGLSPKPLVWIGSARDDLGEFPEEVRSLAGYALFMAQCGLRHEQAKPLRGFGGAGVLEIRRDSIGSTYRVVYTIRLARRIYLHAFQKKSKRGIATPKAEIDLVRVRLKQAEKMHKDWQQTLSES